MFVLSDDQREPAEDDGSAASAHYAVQVAGVPAAQGVTRKPSQLDSVSDGSL